MAKILQVRRGTTDAHNSFTGMPGEISYDTDAKTLRVHDGETLGGFTLARADQMPNMGGGTFDITSVSDEFWANTIKRCAPNPLTIMTSPKMKIKNTVPSVECLFGNIDNAPIFVRTELECQSTDAGYAIGDTVWAFGIGERTNPCPNIWQDDDGLHVRLMVGNEQYWVSHKDTGVKTNVINDNWRLLFRVYC